MGFYFIVSANKFIYEISPFKDDLLLLVNTFGIENLILFHSKEYAAKLSYKEQFDVIYR